jgi:hypothetical protein
MFSKALSLNFNFARWAHNISFFTSRWKWLIFIFVLRFLRSIFFKLICWHRVVADSWTSVSTFFMDNITGHFTRRTCAVMTAMQSAFWMMTKWRYFTVLEVLDLTILPESNTISITKCSFTNLFTFGRLRFCTTWHSFLHWSTGT